MTSRSVDWFREAKKNIFHHSFAVINFGTALEFGKKLEELFDEDEPVIQAGLFRSLVVEYAKPFTEKRGGRKYQFKRISRTKGVEKRIHETIMDLRNKIIAHEDEEFIDRLLITEGFHLGEGDESWFFPTALRVTGLTLYAIKSKPIIEEFNKHIEACVVAGGQIVEGLFDEFAKYAGLNPVAFSEYSKERRVDVEINAASSTANSATFNYGNYNVSMNVPGVPQKDGYHLKAFFIYRQSSQPIKSINRLGQENEVNIAFPSPADEKT